MLVGQPRRRCRGRKVNPLVRVGAGRTYAFDYQAAGWVTHTAKSALCELLRVANGRRDNRPGRR